MNIHHKHAEIRVHGGKIWKWWRHIAKRLVWLALHALWIMPVNRRKIYFSSYRGLQYSCNPRYLYEHLVHTGLVSKYKIVWELRSGAGNDMPLQPVVVAPRTLRGVVECMTARYIVTNAEFPWWIPLRRGQVLLQTWHGGGAYKKVGLEVGWGRLVDYEIKLNSRQITFYVSSCRKFTEIQSRSKCVPEKKFLPTGMPRNSFLLNQDKLIQRRLRQKIGIGGEDRILLYAPTYRGEPRRRRGGGDAGGELLDFARLRRCVTRRFGGCWTVLCRGHYFAVGAFDGCGADIQDMSDHDDMQELLYIADILVTDFSSSMWDFSLLYRPCFLFAPDVDSYNCGRGFYTPPASWPFPLARSNQELESVITAFDTDKYVADVRRHHEELGSYEGCNSPALILKAIGLEDDE